MKMKRKYIIRRRVALAAAVLAVGAVGIVIAKAATPEKEVYVQIPQTVNEEMKEEMKEETEPMEVVKVAAVAEPTPEEPMFNVPLDEEVQRHIIKLCEEHEIPSAVVIAMIERESRFTADVIGDNGNSFGLMQIQPRWHSGRMERLGVTDLLDPKQNVTVGIDLLAELLEKDKGLAWSLMAYNMGSGKANQFYNEGKVSEYAACVLAAAEEFEEGRWM